MEKDELLISLGYSQDFISELNIFQDLVEDTFVQPPQFELDLTSTYDCNDLIIEQTDNHSGTNFFINPKNKN